MKINWEEPPARRYGRGLDTRTDDQKFADELRKPAGQWAVYRDDANSSLAHQIKTGKVAAFQDGPFEAVCRGINAGSSRGRIYVRYVGEQS